MGGANYLKMSQQIINAWKTAFTIPTEKQRCLETQRATQPKEKKTSLKPHKQRQKVVHPNSRKATKLLKQTHHKERVEKRKSERQLVVANQVTKLMWFKEKLDTEKQYYTLEEMLELIDSYLHRNDVELENILEAEAEKSHTSSHYRQQFASREDALRSLIVRERELFEGAGFEAPDLTNPKHFKTFMEWSEKDTDLPKLSLRKFKDSRTHRQ